MNENFEKIRRQAVALFRQRPGRYKKPDVRITITEKFEFTNEVE